MRGCFDFVLNGNCYWQTNLAILDPEEPALVAELCRRLVESVVRYWVAGASWVSLPRGILNDST
jgi:hypothetical protein